MPASSIHLFLKLSHRERFFFVEAYCRLGIYRIAIACISYARLTHTLSPRQGTDTTVPSLSTQQLNTAGLVQTAIRRAANHTPWESACLVQALCAQNMLKRRNIPGSLHLGVMKEGPNSNTFKAHAWIQCDSLVICGSFEPGEFKEISVSTWSGHY